MRFFGDTMANYSVSKKTVIVSNEINPIEKTECYELKRRRSVSSGLTSSTFFNKDTFEVVFGVKDLLLK
ncbi:MAG: hypothetical protein KAG14_02345 [Mycoplasmataceae bacterium]|nr:hypothetical protein [Mycoplasmataceae bacterium]